MNRKFLISPCSCAASGRDFIIVITGAIAQIGEFPPTELLFAWVKRQTRR